MSIQLISVLVLVIISVKVLFEQISGPINTNKILFSIVVVLFLLPAIVFLLPNNGFTDPEKFLVFSYSLENNTAYTLLIVLFWGLASLTDTSTLTTIVTIVLSLLLIWSTWDPKWRPLQSIIRSFCVLFSMMISTFALIRRQKNGVWMVLALMSLAFALKPQLLSPQLGQFETHNFLKAIAIYFVGRAISEGNRPLFKRSIKKT